MNEDIKVKVSFKHIRNGIPKNADRCPIALALREKFPDSLVVVGPIDCYIKLQDNPMMEFNLDDKGRKFIARFDKYKGWFSWPTTVKLTRITIRGIYRNG